MFTCTCAYCFFSPKPKTIFVLHLVAIFFYIGVGQIYKQFVFERSYYHDYDCYVFHLQNLNLTTHLTPFLGCPPPHTHTKNNYIFFLKKFRMYLSELQKMNHVPLNMLWEEQQEQGKRLMLKLLIKIYYDCQTFLNFFNIYFFFSKIIQVPVLLAYLHVHLCS